MMSSTAPGDDPPAARIRCSPSTAHPVLDHPWEQIIRRGPPAPPHPVGCAHLPRHGITSPSMMGPAARYCSVPSGTYGPGSRALYDAGARVPRGPGWSRNFSRSCPQLHERPPTSVNLDAEEHSRPWVYRQWSVAKCSGAGVNRRIGHGVPRARRIVPRRRREWPTRRGRTYEGCGQETISLGATWDARCQHSALRKRHRVRSVLFERQMAPRSHIGSQERPISLACLSSGSASRTAMVSRTRSVCA